MVKPLENWLGMVIRECKEKKGQGELRREQNHKEQSEISIHYPSGHR